MTRGRHIHIPQGGARHLRWALALIIAGFVLTNVVSIYEMRSTQHESQLIVTHIFKSIDLVSSLSRNLYRKRVLVQSHIVASDKDEWDYVESELAIVDNKIQDTLRAYEPIASQEGEIAQVHELEATLAGIQPKVDNVIDLSRANLDAEARRALARTVEPALEAINESTDDLVRFERVRSEQEIGVIRGLQRQAVILLGVLTAAGTTLALLAAAWVTRLVRQREEEMREATALLEERNRELDAFAGRVAHDLRGPLTSINLAAGLLARQCASEERGATVLRNGVEQMEAIIQDLLTLSRVSVQPATAASEVANVIMSVEDDLKPKVEAAGGTLRIDAQAATVSCSEGLLRQVLWNLGENAVKFRRPEARLEVELRGRVTPHGYEFLVADNGAGMSLRETRQAFEPFFRGERTHAIPGAGLGLSIVQRVIEASRGTVSVESTVGKGTTFRILLPFAISKAA